MLGVDVLKSWELPVWHIQTIVLPIIIVGRVSSQMTLISLQGSGIHLGGLPLGKGQDYILQHYPNLNQQPLVSWSYSWPLSNPFAALSPTLKKDELS